MSQSKVKNPQSPDEVRPFEGKGHLDVLKFDEHQVFGRGIFEPGWRWSVNVKPIAQTDSCMASHMGYCVRGHMRVRMNSGEELDIGPGDFFTLEPGHDAWIVGDEACELLDFGGFEDYAKRRESAQRPPPGARPRS